MAQKYTQMLSEPVIVVMVAGCGVTQTAKRSPPRGQTAIRFPASTSPRHSLHCGVLSGLRPPFWGHNGRSFGRRRYFGRRRSSGSECIESWRSYPLE